MSKKLIAAVWLFCLLSLFAAIPAQAEWIKKNNSYVYQDDSGKQYTSKWFAEKNCGFVKLTSQYYCVKQNGEYLTGFLTVDGKKYFVSKDGIVRMNCWLKINGKMYRAGKDGVLYVSKKAKIGKYYYAFDKNGVMLTGFQKINGKKYYFQKANGRMICNTAAKISGERYYFKASGVMVTGKWVNHYYYGSNGKALKNTWVGSRYTDENGKYVTGLKQIDGVYYYFESNGKKIVNQKKVIDGGTYTFDAEGKCTDPVYPGNYESQYYTDPQVSDEILLAAIIYAEAGNQPYNGMVAVGLVIGNRMLSPLFPNTLKEVIYAKQQFEPARNGSLTRMLTNQDLISASAKKAGKEAVKRIKEGNFKFKGEDDKEVDLDGYLFFMTKPAYDRLGITSPYVKVWDHVFFKLWRR